MKKLYFPLATAFFLWHAAVGQTIFDQNQMHEVKIKSLYSGLLDSLTTNYIFSYNFLQQQIRDIPYTYCKVDLDGTPLDTIGIRQKGFNSWWSSPKKSMKLDFNRYKKNQNYQGLKKINLHNRASDPTCMREYLCYDLLRKMGIPAPRTAYTTVYFDGDYGGVYRLVEEIDNEFLDQHFGDHLGNLYKQNAANSTGYALDWQGNQPENYYPFLQLENHRSENDWSGLIHFLDILNNSSDIVFKDSIEYIFDVPSFLRVYALDLAINNYDYYGTSGRNYYLYQDLGGDGKFHWLPWDYNLTWRENPPSLKPDVSMSSVLIRRLLEIPQFRQQFFEQYCVLRTYFNDQTLVPQIDADSTLLSPWLSTDPSGDYTLEDFEQNIGSTLLNLPGLKPFLHQRSIEIDLIIAEMNVDCSLVSTTVPAQDLFVLQVFPNPARAATTLSWPETFVNEDKHLTISDAQGQKVRDLYISGGLSSYQLSLGDMTSGVYFLYLTDGERHVQGRLMVL